MIRPVRVADHAELVRLTAETGFFKPHEIDTLGEVLADYETTSRDDEGHLAFVDEDAGTLRGFAYVAPAPMTLGTWQLWWIVVRKDLQARGVGGGLLRQAESEARSRAGRVLFIDTSSQPLYAPTLAFYLKHGYENHAILRDFYAIGDSMVVFRKDLAE